MKIIRNNKKAEVSTHHLYAAWLPMSFLRLTRFMLFQIVKMVNNSQAREEPKIIIRLINEFRIPGGMGSQENKCRNPAIFFYLFCLRLECCPGH